MLCNGRRLFRSGSVEANAAGLDKSVLYMVRKLVENLADLAHYVGEGCNTEQFLKEKLLRRSANAKNLFTKQTTLVAKMS